MQWIVNSRPRMIKHTTLIATGDSLFNSFNRVTGVGVEHKRDLAGWMSSKKLALARLYMMTHCGVDGRMRWWKPVNSLSNLPQVLGDGCECGDMAVRAQWSL
jgi:hypothetical protein